MSLVITRKIWLPIHNAIHSNTQSVAIEGVTYPVQVFHNGCRMVDYEGVRLMEQNKKKLRSKYAQMAKEGHKITWITSPDMQTWYARVEDGELK